MSKDSAVTWWKQAFTQNLGLKTMALGFALGFFGYIHSKEEIQQRTIPVSVISLPPEGGGRELMTKIPPNIHVTLRGSTRELMRLIQEGLAPVEVDLRSGKTQIISFGRAMFSLPPQLELITVDPPRLELEWEDIITRQIPLQTSITGHPAEGHVVKGEPVVEPQRVTVKGPVSRVEVMQFARLAPFDVSGLTEGRFPRRIAIDPPPDQVRYLGSQAATVTIDIARRTSEKLFTSIPVEVIGPAHALVVPRTVDITVIGLPEMIRNLREDQIVPQADLTAAGKWNAETQHGSVNVPVTVNLSGAKIESQPPTVTVRW